jgi:2-polyprenyl-3-methyl-5-hydroxy-6-metoxy-1,4-benzoquinol methylase
MAEPMASEYDEFADALAAYTADREHAGPDGDALLLRLLGLLGDIRGKRVLDAACGEGYLARVLAARGARVTGIDLGPRLIAKARARDPAGSIDYRIADLSQPLPGETASFDAVACHLALNDVAGYQGFAATLAGLLRPGGRMAIAMNNPYGAVVRGNVGDYFDSGSRSPYRGLWARGIRTNLRHRTMEEYLDAFLAPGLRLTKLGDVPEHSHEPGQDSILPPGGRFPRFVILAFAKP